MPPESELVEQVEKLLAKEKSLEQQLAQLRNKAAHAEAGALETQAREIKGVKVLAAQVEGFDRQQLRTLVDSLRNKWKTAVVVLATVEDGSIAIVSGVTKDLTAKVHAGKLAGSWSRLSPSEAKAADGLTWRKPAAKTSRHCRPRSSRCTPQSRECFESADCPRLRPRGARLQACRIDSCVDGFSVRCTDRARWSRL